MTPAALNVTVNVIGIETTCPFRPSLADLKHLMIAEVLLLTHSLQLCTMAAKVPVSAPQVIIHILVRARTRA